MNPEGARKAACERKSIAIKVLRPSCSGADVGTRFA
jgi:hypothetical protein